MPKIITVAHQKGGVGKTTLSLALYYYLMIHEAKCAIVDTDPQKSIARLYQTIGQKEDWGKLQLIDRGDFKNYKDLLDFETDFLIVDTPPAFVDEIGKVMRYSDFVLIPCKASPLDILAIEDTIEQIEQTKAKANPNLKAGIVMNQIIPNTKFVSSVRVLLKQKYPDIPILDTHIHNRSGYATYLMRSLFLHDQRDKKADSEISSLANEIIHHLNA